MLHTQLRHISEPVVLVLLLLEVVAVPDDRIQRNAEPERHLFRLTEIVGRLVGHVLPARCLFGGCFVSDTAIQRYGERASEGTWPPSHSSSSLQQQSPPLQPIHPPPPRPADTYEQSDILRRPPHGGTSRHRLFREETTPSPSQVSSDKITSNVPQPVHHALLKRRERVDHLLQSYRHLPHDDLSLSLHGVKRFLPSASRRIRRSSTARRCSGRTS